ncbi:beach-domain-containing protein [Imleria badia]|nr:beach-domain-containing protein [Imleria badia]
MSGETSLKKAIRDGVLINEASILCKLVSKDIPNFPPLDIHLRSKRLQSSNIAISGPLIAIPCRPLELALWSIGGAQLVLCLVSLAETSHELSRTIAILCDSLRNCWENSEDMERVAGYDVLANILYQKSHLVNMTTFEILFEFLGLSFRSPDTSTITNTIAYVAIALDFELWSMTTPDIQRAHLEHFAFILRASRYRKFNAKARLSKLNLVRRLLFALQSPWYPPETVGYIASALGVVMQAHFSANDAIKPVASYIAANVTSEPVPLPSPRVSISGGNNNSEKARPVLDAVISLLRIPTMYMKFSEALPVARIALLWLGPEPSPALVCQVLAIIGISFGTSTSFGKKFELASGWLMLKKVLPPIWNDAIHEAVLDLLLQPAREGGTASKVVKCPQMLAVVLLALRQGLLAHSDTRVQGPSRLVVERILDDLIDLHKSHSSFRQLFKSQSATGILVECLSSSPGNDDPQVSTQLIHLGSLVAMGNQVAPTQKQQILEITKTGSQPSSHAVTSSSSRLASVQEETLRKSGARLEEWRNTIVASERERYRKTFIDVRERRRRIAVISEGILGGSSERDVWCHIGPERTWRLDETEAPHRTRNKLEPFTDLPVLVHHAETNNTTNDERDTDVSSTLQMDGSTKDDAEAFSDENGNGNALADEIAEDKHRRVRHELEPGDIIEAVSTICRVSGVDSYPGLLIFGHTHLYMLDGLIENEVGELIDAVDAPKGMFFVAGSTPHVRSPQRARRWSLEQIAGFSNKSFLFRDVALEIFFKDSRTLLAIFLDGAHRHDVSQRLQVIITRHSTQEHASTLGLVLREMSIAMPKGMGRAALTADDKALATAQRQWQNREISNYTYLSILNQLSGRTPSDATQYPVFPWVLKDYTSDTLDLSSPDSFRDLSKPMGALTPERFEIARNRYENLESVGEKPFHYGTHFSSSMIVCHFLIRMAPYTSMFKTLQGGDWDLPDRLFIDIGRTYLSASQDVRGDVRELIPEFFTCPEFLENLSNIDFGSLITTGERIHNVKLPPWAKGDALLFVHMHRQALESRYVSENLPAWIDLIWGYKQHDIDSLNVFHPLSYEGAIDLDKITDPLEREATIGIIHNFGQTPRKLFSSPHPPRNLQGILSLPVRASRGVPEDALALTRDSRIPVAKRYYARKALAHRDPMNKYNGEKMMMDGILFQVTQTIEAMSPTCAAFADQDTLVTGSDDSLVRVWRLSHAAPSTSPFVGSTTTKTRKGQGPSLTLVHLLRKHSAPIISLHVSRAWSVVISGSLDGSAILWDLNRGLYVRSIWHAGDCSIEDAAVHLVAINESTGYIATCSTYSLWLHTINARPVARLDLTSNVPRARVPCVTSIAFHERDYSHLGILAIGHADGSVSLYTWNAEDTPEDARAQWGFLKVRDLEAEKNDSASITSLDFIGRVLFSTFSTSSL